MATGSSNCSLLLQKEEIQKILKTPLKKGDTWYLVDTKWFKQWKKFVGFDNWDTSYVGDQSANPGPIDNSPLLKEGTKDQLREHLIDELDYNLVPADGWHKLLEWYTISDGQEPIARKVIEQGMFVKHCKVEVYLMDLKLCQNSEIDNHVLKQFSRADTIDNIEKEMRTLFSISDDTDVRLWNKYLSNTYEHLNKPDNTVQDAGLYQGQVIVIEKKNEDGTWPRQTKVAGNAIHSNTLEIDSCTNASSKATTSGYSSGNYGSSSYSSYGGYDGYRSSAAPGLCGLSNLGNTCFMNSAIQCMSNVPHLCEYFMSGQWKEELNLDNPLGMKGEIASSYAELIRNMWSGKYSYTVPRNFKVAVGRFAPQFSGYQQQDSQELMAFLLDGLHEDLNRIKKKPYVELKDANGRPDEEVAKESWDNYLKRNDSIIVDIFHGLLKSTLVCPECSKVSVTFDPFCYLSLPLPVKKERQIEVFLVPLDPMRKTVHYKLTVPKLGCVADLCKALSKLTSIPPDKMVVTDVYNHKFHKVFSNDEALSHILDRDDIFIYEVPVSSGEDPDTIIVPIYMKEKKPRQGYSNYPHQTTSQLFGQPMLVATSRHNTSSDQLYNCILNRMARFTKKPHDNEEWWKTASKDKQENVTVNGEMASINDEEEESADETNNASEEGADANDVNEEDIINEADRKPPRLFTFTCVNSYGTAEVDAIKDDGKPIKFSNRTYIAIEWHPRAKEMFYDEKAAELIETHDSVNTRPMQRKQIIQLNECLELFTTTEKLGEQDPWYCPRCKKHQQATKKFDLWSLPKVLVIHLKRFSYNRYWRDKLDTYVEYPTRGLNMKQFVINRNHCPAVYDLIAVSNHYGGMGGGHYTAFAKNKDDGQWYHFDDSSVSQCAEDSAVTKAGYVLVYQRRDSHHEGTYNGRQPSAAAGSPTEDSEEMMITTNGEQSSEDEMDIN